MSLQQIVTEQFRAQFGAEPTLIVRAPGRVNLIGEHTDYNDGFVLPMAIDRAVWIALRPRADHTVNLYSVDFSQAAAFDLNDFSNEKNGWIEYVKGVAWALLFNGHRLQGWEGVVAGDVPIGAGLSSSAAMEMATARAFSAVTGFAWDAVQMAKVGQRAENEWIGVKSGIMDQMISAAGREGYALLIDCRSLDAQPAPLPHGTIAVVLDTSTRRGLVDSAYNERRAQCEAAAQFFGVRKLRDVTAEQFAAKADGLDPLTRKRALHVITENSRTLQAVEAMRADNAELLGKLMDASHTSLRDDFEVSSDALNTIVECAKAQKGCYGARMTGAGFGGCAVALVDIAQADSFVSGAAQAYSVKTGLTPNIYVCKATNGAEVIKA